MDCTIEVEEFKVGRLNRIDGIIENLSGKALNTAIGIKRLGGEVFSTGFMFETGGRRFIRYLSGEGIDNKFVWNKGRVRVNYKIIDGKSMMTEINDKGEFVSAKSQEDLISIIEEYARKAEIVVISGSLPSGVDDRFYYDMVKACGKTKVIADAETGKLKAALDAGVFMVKPNLYELETFFSERYDGYEHMVDGCKKLIDLGAKRVMLSFGKEGSIFTDGETSYFCKSESVAINSTVGAGDSMVAAASLAISENATDEEVLKRAVAAATASVTTAGTNLFTKEKYLEILNKLTVRKI